MKQYLMDVDAALLCGLSVKTLRNYRQQGRGPAYFKIGRSVRYSTDDLQQWLNSHRITTQQKGGAE